MKLGNKEPKNHVSWCCKQRRGIKLEEPLYTELLLAKDLRIDTQYYVTEQIDKEKLKTDSATARNFVLKMEEVIENITETQITKIRQKLTNRKSKHIYTSQPINR